MCGIPQRPSRAAGGDSIVALTILFHDIGKPECYTEDEDGRGGISMDMAPVSARITESGNETAGADEETN